MSIETLPVELLEHMIEAAVPPVTDRATVKERYLTLCACSLVSQRWRRVAQRLLLRIVDVTTWRGMSKLLTSSKGDPTRALLVKVVNVRNGEKVDEGRALAAFRALQELFIGARGSLDLAVLSQLPHLQTLSVWGAHVVFTGNIEHTVLPALQILSTCYGSWDHSARAILAPRHLPKLQGLAFHDGPGNTEWFPDLRDWHPDLQAFPPFLRIVASTTARLILRESQHVVLYDLMLSKLLLALDAGYFVNGLWPQDVRHLLLTYDKGSWDYYTDGLEQILDTAKRLPQLETLGVALDFLHSTPTSRKAFSAYIKQHKIKHFSLKWCGQFTNGSLVPPQWLEM